MNNIESVLFGNIVEQLLAHSAQQGLIDHAIDGCRRWWDTEPESLPYPLDAIRTEFASHALYFRNALLPYPYIETRLRLITFPDGRDEDDYLVFDFT